MSQQANEYTLDEYVEVLSRENPAFAEAMAEERRGEAHCADIVDQLVQMRTRQGVSVPELSDRMGFAEPFVTRIEETPHRANP